MAKRTAARKGGRRGGGNATRRASAQRQGSSSRRTSARQATAGRGGSKSRSSGRGQRSSSRQASAREERGNGRSPSAVRFLKQDHQEVSKLLERFEDASGGEKTRIAHRICAALTVHAQIEEELLYPAARRALEDDDRELVNEAAVEHASIKDLVGQIEAGSGSDELFEAKVKVLGEYVKHHVGEEENELFPRLQKTELDLEALGKQLAARKAELASTMGIESEEGEDEESERESGMRPPRPGGRGSRPVAGRNA